MHYSFKFLFPFLLFIFIGANAAILSSQSLDNQMAKFAKLRVNSAEQYEKIKNLHENLYYGAMKALLGQLGRHHYRKMAEGERRKLAKCLDQIESRFDLVSSARCLVESRERHLELEELRREGEGEEGIGMAFAQEIVEEMPKKMWKSSRLNKFSRKVDRKKMMERRKLSRIIIPRKIVGKKQLDKCRDIRMRMKRNDGMDIDEMRKMRKHLEEGINKIEDKKEEYPIRSANSTLPLASRDEKTLASRISNLLLKAMGPKTDEASIRWSKAQKTLEGLAQQIDRSKHFPGTKVYEKRMYDIVLEKDEPSLGPNERHSPIGLLQEGIKLLEMMPMNGPMASKGQSAQHNFRMFSPRFMPLMPDKGGPTHPNSMLSPILLAMYDEKDNRSIGNVPQMLRKAGVSERDRQSIIATLMELTGTTGHIEKALGLLEEVDFFKEGVGHPLMNATDRVLNAFFSLEDLLDGGQRRECAERGFTFVTKGQLFKLLRDQAVDGAPPLSLPPKELANFERLEGMSAEEKELALWATVEQIAGRRQEHRRGKRQIIRLRVFEPIILSPFQFAPTLGLVVFGPIILSPSIFSPSVLAPSVFSPLILSPLVFSPFVISPSLGSPWILTPGVANPYIISPYIFSPFILGPLALHPFVLSPYILSPNILNPYVLSPIVLNPIALSPDILSPQVLGGAVFSPAMLSPAILTQTYLMVSIFSPTFLS